MTNPANWQLVRNGSPVAGLISKITYAYNPNTHEFVATLTFLHPLASGNYQLIAKAAIHDLSGRSLNSGTQGIGGGAGILSFIVSPTQSAGNETRVNSVGTTGNQMQPVGATDAAGDYVVVWVSQNLNGTGSTIMAQRYHASGVASGGEFQVNAATTSRVASPAVAMDSSGDFAAGSGPSSI